MPHRRTIEVTMQHKRANIKKLITANNTVISGFDVDDFFTKEVLSKRLKNPLKQHAESLCVIYNIFHRRLHTECRYTEMTVKQDGQNILFSVFFDCVKHKFMLVFFAQDNVPFFNQDHTIAQLLTDYDDIKESNVSLRDENLPPYIHSLVHDLVFHEGAKNLRLKKIETHKGDKTIAFHHVSFPIDLEHARGVSILAGFQY